MYVHAPSEWGQSDPMPMLMESETISANVGTIGAKRGGMEGPEYNQFYAMVDSDVITANVGSIGAKRGGPPLQQQPQQIRRLADRPPLPSSAPEICQFFVQGRCAYGHSCTKSHAQPTNMRTVQMSPEEYNLFQMNQRSRSQQQTATNQTRMGGQYSNVKPSGHYGSPSSSSSQGR